MTANLSNRSAVSTDKFKKWLKLDYRSRNSDCTRDAPPQKDWPYYYDYVDKTNCHFMTPRMALKFYEAGCSLLVVLHEQWDEVAQEDSLFPKCCDPYLKNNFWKISFMAAIHRVIFRLTKGLVFQPNCTAEEMAVHMIYEYLDRDYNFDPKWNEEMMSLPNYGQRDTKFEETVECGVEDEDVLMLFDKNERMVRALLNDRSYLYHHCGIANLHPSTWFLAFRDHRFDDASITTPCNEGTIWTRCMRSFGGPETIRSSNIT